ncbi:MAG: putative mutator protein MutT4 [Phycisphaerae bacterium]|nr:putative mutator protein MutT4 [Phycisphaerae bacterium]
MVVFHDGPGGRRWLALRSRKGHWDFPKGHVAPGETPRDAAMREMAEEAGLTGQQVELLPGFHRQLRYFVSRPGKLAIRKTVHYFLGCSRTGSVRISDEHTESAWLPLDEALARFQFEDARDLLRAADEFARGKG